MLSQCKGCEYHRNDNSEMRAAGNKTITGDFCIKFGWNLNRVKDWVAKKQEKSQSTGTFPKMRKLPKVCYHER